MLSEKVDDYSVSIDNATYFVKMLLIYLID